jgi:hypothetical protein
MVLRDIYINDRQIQSMFYADEQGEDRAVIRFSAIV